MSGKFDSNLPDVTLDAEPPETLRDRFAMAALSGLIAAGVEFSEVRSLAYLYADEMLAERRK